MKRFLCHGCGSRLDEYGNCFNGCRRMGKGELALWLALVILAIAGCCAMIRFG